MSPLKTILVIDDELGYREMLQMDLSEEGYRVLTADGGPAALEILRNGKIDLVVTDMKMPKMDGLEIVVAVKEFDPSIPVVLMTGYAVEDLVKRALELKAATCLRKPFDVQELATIIRTALPS